MIGAAGAGFTLLQSPETWLDAIPAGLIIINPQGNVQYFNSQAKEYFENNVAQNQKWSDLLAKYVTGSADNGYYLIFKTGKSFIFKTQALANEKGQIILLMDETKFHINKNEQAVKYIDSVGKLSAVLAHQLRTPLATALLYASSLQPHQDNVQELLLIKEKIITQLKIIQDQIDSVLLVHRHDKVFIQEIDLQQELKQMVTDYRALYPNYQFMLNLPVCACKKIVGNLQAIRSALCNVIDNAIQASPEKALIEIVVKDCLDKISITIKDYGTGVQGQNMNLIAQPFFTTKKNGTGLGLAITKSILESHQGEFSFTCEEGVFTAVEIKIPYNLMAMHCEN